MNGHYKRLTRELTSNLEVTAYYNGLNFQVDPASVVHALVAEERVRENLDYATAFDNTHRLLRDYPESAARKIESLPVENLSFTGDYQDPDLPDLWDHCTVSIRLTA